MLVSDQRALDGLLFVRHIASRLVQEEFDPKYSVPQVFGSYTG
jgi:hypothetical protein